jgi:hypothetical protein
LIQEARRIHHEIGSFEHEAGCIEELGDIAAMVEEPSMAENLYQQAIAIYRQLSQAENADRVMRKIGRFDG